ncbi:LytR family transcriptional regulator [Romboutsia weinsteinii]|uniref:LytR family transcriptional regulator n=1 Tax=Romboutsia weinsteinii TaxID=2020949 RepID=A0A371J3T3_9FIRM|nr:LCP family protein [Romboutsia weinsteinii]RDY27395.1 LytR family transcriptional regulator [Romboutsia weinsteinii]
MSNLKKLVVFLLALVIIIPATAFGYMYYKLSTIHEGDSDSEKIVSSSDYKSEKGIHNILLVGVDTTDKEQVSRSDAMMILTIDSNSKSLKLTSLARDTYVNIKGRGKEKLTHAYAYGGISLLLQTVEENFELDIQDYVVVNFNSFMSVLDVIGGIEVDVSASELEELRYFTIETYYLGKYDKKGPIDYVESPGTQTLNAYQALAYARIRKNDTAFDRDERQRKILQATLNKLTSLPFTKYNSLIDGVLPHIKTNMKPGAILKTGSTVLGIGDFDIKQLEFPILEYSEQGIYEDAGWVVRFDEDKCIPILHDFIFKNKMYTP